MMTDHLETLRDIADWYQNHDDPLPPTSASMLAGWAVLEIERLREQVKNLQALNKDLEDDYAHETFERRGDEDPEWDC